jgi:hypothetical protein
VEFFEGMEHEKPVLDTKHYKMVLLLIEMATFYIKWTIEVMGS